MMAGPYEQFELLKYTPLKILQEYRSRSQRGISLSKDSSGLPSGTFLDFINHVSQKNSSKEMLSQITQMSPQMIYADQVGSVRLPFYDVTLSGIRWDVKNPTITNIKRAGDFSKEEVLIKNSGIFRIHLCPHVFQRLHISYSLEPAVHAVVVELTLEEGSFCDFTEIIPSLPSETYLARLLKIQLKKNAYICHMLERKGHSGYVRSDIMVELDEQGARACLWGALEGNGTSHNDLVTVISHRASGTDSHQFYKLNLDQQGRLSSLHHVMISSDARESNAQQLVKALLLNDQVDVKVKPMLDIRCDEVKANHGVAFSTLSGEELFYLKSRGIPEDQARLLLESGFLSEVYALKEQDCDREMSKRFSTPI
ncbi:MAG: SufD family Fe-S cluster assembly protein [Bdellovibrionaceae bacterium]|nr:SufD family Fe-S cluster assembly protein [Pseudobdellovibrionaceae bacterium]MDW8191098.1 SufD family Fe-S cluster assembly protein [Pseudobdellovibrionaceae bacterium]